MPKPKPKRQTVTDTNEAISRPEDPNTQRQKRAARVLRVDDLPAGAAMMTQDEELAEDSETEAALRRATDATEDARTSGD